MSRAHLAVSLNTSDVRAGVGFHSIQVVLILYLPVRYMFIPPSIATSREVFNFIAAHGRT